MGQWRILSYHPNFETFYLTQIKYVWGAFGLLLCAVPVFFTIPGSGASSLGSRTQSMHPLQFTLMT